MEPKRRKLTEAELKAAAARLDEIYAPAFAMIEARQKEEAAKARVKQPLVRPEPEKAVEKVVAEFPRRVVEFPPKLSEQELARKQAILDQQYQAILDERAFLRRQRLERCGGSFHKSIDDDDFDLGA